MPLSHTYSPTYTMTPPSSTTEDVNAGGEERARTGQEANQDARDLSDDAAATLLLPVGGSKLNLEAVSQQDAIAVQVCLDHGGNLVPQGMKLALSTAHLAKTMGSDSWLLSSTSMGPVRPPDGGSLHPGRSVAFGEDIPGMWGHGRLENLPESLNQSFTGVVGAKAGDTSPLAVDADVGTAVGILGVVGATISIGVDEGVGDDASPVSAGGVDLLPRLLEQVKVSNVNQVVTEADLDLDLLGQDAGDHSGEEGDGKLHDLCRVSGV